MRVIRKPSVSKSISARTTGRVKRSVKRATNPLYGNKGMGFVKNPKRSVKNSIYHKTTVGGLSSIKSSSSTSSNDNPNLIDSIFDLIGALFELVVAIVIMWFIFSILF